MFLYATMCGKPSWEFFCPELACFQDHRSHSLSSHHCQSQKRARVSLHTTSSSSPVPSNRVLNPFTFLPYRPRYHILREQSQALPVTRHIPVLLRALNECQVLVMVGETGSGKSTQFPKEIVLADKEVSEYAGPMLAMTQPRQMAASMVAERIADLLDVDVGATVGVRYKGRRDVMKDATRLEVVTDGTLLKAFKADKLLSRYKYVFIDEAHERTNCTDLLLGLLKGVMQARKDFKVVITSATLDANMFATYFAGNTVRVEQVQGRSHKVLTSYLSKTADDTLIHETVQLILQVHQADSPGDILVFAPGVLEIGKVIDRVRKHLEGENPSFSADAIGALDCYALHARLSRAEREQCVSAPPPICEGYMNIGRKLIVATNVAETSVTIPNVTHVIDMCDVKVKLWNPRARYSQLPTLPISQAQARQRSGRAGREREGKAIRLCAQKVFDHQLPTHSTPSILRSDCMSEELAIATLKRCPFQFSYVSRPSIDTMLCTMETLRHYGGIKMDGSITVHGEILAALPVDVTLAQIVWGGVKYKCSSEIISIVAMIDASDAGSNLWQAATERQSHARLAASKRSFRHPRGDHFTLLTIYMAYRNARQNGTSDEFCQEKMLQASILRKVDALRLQLISLVRRAAGVVEQGIYGPQFDANLARALCFGLFLQSARRSTLPKTSSNNKTKTESARYKTFRGLDVEVSQESVDVAHTSAEYVVYHEAFINTEGKRQLHIASAVEPEYLLAAQPGYWRSIDVHGQQPVNDLLKLFCKLASCPMLLSMPPPQAPAKP